VRILWLLFTATLLLSAEGKLEHITLNENDFSIVTEAYDIYDSKGKVVKLYFEARNNDLLHRLSFTLHDETGSCSGKSVEDGAYEIDGNTITFYSFFDRRGRVYDVPYGARIMRYEVQKDGMLKKTESRLYIETSRKSFDKESAIQFLWKPAETEEEKKAFEGYIESVERQYKGTFVFVDEANALMDEVQKALERKMSKRWK